MDVTAYGSNQVSFMFTNAVGKACSITDVYFDDGSLLGIAAINQSLVGVSFSQLANPANLPDGNNAVPAFVATAEFSADSNPPVTANGVDQTTEWLQIIFGLKENKDFDDVIDALSLAGGEGGLRIGIHVQGFEITGPGGPTDTLSESLINNPVPIHGAVWLLGSGLVGFGVFGRNRKQRH